MVNNNKTPEELRAEHLLKSDELDRKADVKRNRLYKKWIWASAVIGLAMSIINYSGISYACIAHFILSGLIGYVMLYFKRGHLSGVFLFGIGNEIVTLIVGFFNPFGILAFCCAGAAIGVGMRLDYDGV